MKLLLDVGNTRIKAAYDNGREMGPCQAVVHAGGSDPGLALSQLDTTLTPTAIWASCVAGPVMQTAIADWAEQHWSLPVHFVATTAEAAGVSNAYPVPGNLGVDRWLAVIAAHHRGEGAACVVDAGTCLTLDVVDATGRHLGGLIAPGVTSQRAAVWGRTQVRAETDNAGLSALADNTDEAVGYGTLHGPLGLIERVLRQLGTPDFPERLLLTGGEADLLFPHLSHWTLVPGLVLEGLAVMAEEQTALPGT